MADQQRRTVINAFESRDHAERAVNDLRSAGYTDDDIGWAMRHEEAPEGTHDVASGAAAGAVTGGVLGGLGAAAAMALIPGVGPFIAGGALATILTTAGVSAAAGGLLGGLAGLGASEEEAKFYDQEFRAGRPVMTVNAGDRYDHASEIMRRSGGYDYASRGMGGTSTAGTMTGTTTTSERIVATTRDSDEPTGAEAASATEYGRTRRTTDRI
jgi:hypothetical protein